MKNEDLRFLTPGGKLAVKLMRQLQRPKPKERQRVEKIPFYCRTCWLETYVDVLWSEMEGKTMQELVDLVNKKHGASCDHPDARFYATKTRR